VADWALVPRPGAFAVRRRLPAAVELHHPAEVGWVVESRAPRRAVVHVADELAPSLRAGRRRFRVDLAPQAVATVTTAIRPARRGRFEPREVVVRVEGPLGLVARQGRRDLPGLLKVHPSFRSRREAALRIEQARIL